MKAAQAPVLFERDGAIARITFNRPEVFNAFDHACAVALLDACRSIAADPAFRVVVLSGNGRAFMAGGAIRTFPVAREEAPAFFESLIALVHEAIEILAELDQPVVASLHGAVAGVGLSFALAADLAIAADDVRFTLGYTKLGLSADGSSSWSLPRLVGLRRAMEMALLSDVYGADDALRLGLVNRVVPAAALAAETDALARRLAAGATVALGQMKRLLRQSFQRSCADQLEAESEAIKRCALTRDYVEGIDAFLTKRPAAFEGR